MLGPLDGLSIEGGCFKLTQVSRCLFTLAAENENRYSFLNVMFFSEY